MKFNKYFPFAFIYFFINAVALPFGVTWTALLAPFFYIWILLTRKKEVLLPFIAILLPFVLIHIMVVGVDTKSYAFSCLNLVAVYIFCQAVYTFLTVSRDAEKVFRWLLWVNFVFCLFAIILYFTPWSDLLWMEQKISRGLDRFKRLKLLTYEPSYYALLFTPLFFFFLYQYLFRQNIIKAVLLLPMLFLPYVLSFSIGVIATVIAAGLLTWILWFRKLTAKRRVLNTLIYAGAGLFAGVAILVLFFRNNPLFVRVGNILRGDDTSGRGRTSDAFHLAGKLLDMKNEYWGIGIGQIKIIGESLIREYYLYYKEMTVTIPNAVAETWAIFGWVGLSLRFALELFLFFYTRAWSDYYRLSLFFFIFIYQFTGSFITNIAEYVIWILAFTPLFPQFKIKETKTAQDRSRG